MTKALDLLIRESWAIEGKEFLQLDKDDQHLIKEAHIAFLNGELTVEKIIAFVKVCEPEASPRFTEGLDVVVYGHVPMKGGPDVLDAFTQLVGWMKSDQRPSNVRAFDAYWRYLHLHPFTDCNGRSARAIWLKVGGFPPDGQGFLETYHYQSLTWQDAYRPVEDRPASSNLT